MKVTCREPSPQSFQQTLRHCEWSHSHLHRQDEVQCLDIRKPCDIHVVNQNEHLVPFHLLEGEYSMVMPRSSIAAPSKVTLLTFSAFVSSSRESSLRMAAFSAATLSRNIYLPGQTLSLKQLPAAASAGRPPCPDQLPPSLRGPTARSTMVDQSQVLQSSLPLSQRRWRAGRRSSRPPAAQGCTWPFKRYLAVLSHLT